MIKVFTAKHAAEAHLVRGLLQVEGVAVEIRGESLTDVWVIQDVQVPLSMAALGRYSREEDSPEGQGEIWFCPACGEAYEPHCNGCWQCGTLRPVSA